MRGPAGGLWSNSVTLASFFCPQARLSAALTLLLVSLSAANGSASAACRVQLTGSDDAAWLNAKQRLEAELALLPGADCAEISVQVSPAGALLRFKTHDQRVAVRTVSTPEELLPTVQALGVTVSVPTPPASEDSSIPDKVLVPPPPPAGSGPAFGGHFGVRAGANGLVSPILGGFAAIGLKRWELGVLGRVEMHYTRVGRSEPKPIDSTGFAFGVSVGRREPLGNVSLMGGAALLLAGLREDSGTKRGRAEARIGGYTGVSWPRSGRWRLRSDLGGELVPYHVGKSERDLNGNTSLPWFAFHLGLGMEFYSR